MNLDFVRMLAIAIVVERLWNGWGAVGARYAVPVQHLWKKDEFGFRAYASYRNRWGTVGGRLGRGWGTVGARHAVPVQHSICARTVQHLCPYSTAFVSVQPAKAERRK